MLDRIRDINEFPGVIRKPNPLHVSNMKKPKRIEVTVASTSLSDDPVLIEKYKATVVMKSLNETKGASARDRM